MITAAITASIPSGYSHLYPNKHNEVAIKLDKLNNKNTKNNTE